MSFNGATLPDIMRELYKCDPNTHSLPSAEPKSPAETQFLALQQIEYKYKYPVEMSATKDKSLLDSIADSTNHGKIDAVKQNKRIKDGQLAVDSAEPNVEQLAYIIDS